MKKVFSLMLLLATICIALQSCSNNDIIGSWERTLDFRGYDKSYQVIDFSEDGTYKSQIYDEEGNPMGGCSESGTYTYKGSTLTLTDKRGREESTTASIKGDKLIVSSLDGDGEIIYIRK